MDKVYLILGASSDLGCALIERLLENKSSNYMILAHYHSSDMRLKELSQSSDKMKIINADLSSLPSTLNLIEQIKEMEIHPTHIVSFSASPYRFNRLEELDVQRLNQDMTIQVYSFAMVCKAFIPHMVEKRNGKIVVMLSAATIGEPPKFTTEYSIVKYGLLGLVKSLASDYGEYGININAISPGMIDTKFLRNIGRKIREFTAEKSPLHRNLKVDDVIPMLLMLLSDDSLFMNGTNINLSGKPD